MSVVSITHSVQTVPLTQYEELERKYEKLGDDYAGVVSEKDLELRVRRNQKMSLTDKFMYCSLVEICPALLDDTPMIVNPYRVRENAGWVSARSATSFFAAMKAIGAISYDLEKYNPNAEKDEDKRPVYITPNPELFPYPENFDLKSVEKRKKEREADKKKKQAQAQAWRLYQCEQCGSPDIRYDLHPICNSCKHVHTPMTDIAGERITITVVENDDPLDWTQEDIPEEYELVEAELTDDDLNAFGPRKVRG